MEPKKAPYEALIAKHLSHSLSPAEKEELDRWLFANPQNKQLLQELESVWAQTENYGQTVNPDMNLAWEKLENRLGLKNEIIASKGKSNVFKMFSATRVAAAILLLAVLTWLAVENVSGPKMIEVAALANETKAVKLPDGSTIWLAKNSYLLYAADMNKANQRNVTLTGEAFFEVAKNKERPFIIQALETRTEVLGTSFNIRAVKGAENISVSVVTGKVRFSKGATKEPLYLEPGTRGIYKRNNDQLQKTSFQNQNFLSWKTGQLQFNNTTLQQVLDDLGRHYGVQFTIKNQQLASQRITTSFGNEPLEEVISVLQTLLDVQIEKEGDTYRVQ